MVNAFCFALRASSAKKRAEKMVCQNVLIKAFVLTVLPLSVQGQSLQFSSPQELVGRIRESERQITSLQGHVISTVPANKTNPDYMDDRFLDVNWAYSDGRQVFGGLVFALMHPGEPMLGVRRIIAFDGDRLRIVGDDTPGRIMGRITSLKLPGFHAYPLPMDLFGYNMKASWETLGEALAGAKQLRLRPAEEIDGHTCIPIEAVGLDSTFVGADPIDGVVWIDVDRGFRPLAWQIYLGYNGKNRFKATYRQVDHVQLRKINGQWIPISGEFTSFIVNAVKPSNMTDAQVNSLTHEQVIGVLDLRVVPEMKILIHLVPNSIRVNEPLPEGTFTINYPKGCMVVDDFTNSSSTVTDGPETLVHPLLDSTVRTLWITPVSEQVPTEGTTPADTTDKETGSESALKTEADSNGFQSNSNSRGYLEALMAFAFFAGAITGYFVWQRYRRVSK